MKTNFHLNKIRIRWYDIGRSAFGTFNSTNGKPTHTHTIYSVLGIFFRSFFSRVDMHFIINMIQGPSFLTKKFSHFFCCCSHVKLIATIREKKMVFRVRDRKIRWKFRQLKYDEMEKHRFTCVIRLDVKWKSRAWISILDFTFIWIVDNATIVQPQCWQNSIERTLCN